MEHPIKMDDLGGGNPPIFGVTSICVLAKQREGNGHVSGPGNFGHHPFGPLR